MIACWGYGLIAARKAHIVAGAFDTVFRHSVQPKTWAAVLQAGAFWAGQFSLSAVVLYSAAVVDGYTWPEGGWLRERG